MAMKAHTYYTIFGRPPVGGEASPLPNGGATGPVARLFYRHPVVGKDDVAQRAGCRNYDDKTTSAASATAVVPKNTLK